MPLFGYKCNSCGNLFDVLVLSDKDKEVVCRKCGSDDATKLITSFSTGASTSNAKSCSSKYFS